MYRNYKVALPRCLHSLGVAALFLSSSFCVAETDTAALSSVQLPLRAEKISADNIAALPRSGPDAIAGIGDWWLTNGILCVAVSDVGHHAGIVSGGGTLVDVALCDKANDQWTYANFLTGFSKESAIPFESMSAESFADSVQLVARGQRDGISQTIYYRLGADSDELSIELELRRVGEGPAIRSAGLFILHSQRALTPFSLSSANADNTLGFAHPYIDRQNKSSMIAGLMPNDWGVLVGAATYPSQVSYGVQLTSAELQKADGSRHALPRFLAMLPNYSLHGWLSRPLWRKSERLSWLSMLQNQFMDIKEGEVLRASFRLAVGARSDVASITDRIYDGPELRGYSNDPGASITVWDELERPISQVRVDSDGSFKMQLPADVRRVKIQATAPWGEKISRELSITDTLNDSGRWIFKRRGRLRLPREEAMSLHLFGIGHTADPQFGNDQLGFSEEGVPKPSIAVSRRIDLAGVVSDPETVDLPPGQYRVLVSRGLEYNVGEYLLTVVAGKTSELPIVTPRQVWHESDWRSADLHVHSGGSFDSSLGVDQRLRSFAAQGGEILVAAEHNRLIDYRPRVAALGLSDSVQLLVGSEITGLARTDIAPYTTGHSNVFPLEADDQAFAGGVLATENMRLGAVIGAYKAQAPTSIFQLNHPRAKDSIDRDMAFFEHLSQGQQYDPGQSLDSEGNSLLLQRDANSGLRDIDFDAIELINGAEFDTYEQLRRDWFSLLNQGVKRTATANSDSHGLGEAVAVPRNYLFLPGLESLPAGEEQIVNALRKGQSFMTTGPFMRLTLVADSGVVANLGEQLSASKSELHIEIDAADWVNVNTMTVWVNGKIYRELDVAVGQHRVIDLRLLEDAYVVVELRGVAGQIYRALLPGLAPLALSNPIYIDADGDGRWLAPSVMNSAPP